MAEMKKYLDTVALGALVDQIKAEDAKALKAAKDYSDGLATNYDAAGSAASALTDAKAYTDQLANGAVKTNTDAIATLNGDATKEGSVAKAIADAKAIIDADIDSVEGKADKNATDIATINNAETGILAQAKKYTDDEVAEVQGNVDDLAAYVGTIPEGATSTNVVAYVQEKTAGIATSENLQELTNRVAQAETDIDNIEKDYLKAADKTELEGKITNVETAVATEKSRAEGIEAGLRTDVDAIKGDYLKAADKTELQGNIDTVAGAVERLTNGVSAEEIDGVNDLIQYVKEHGTEVTGMQEDISKNTENINYILNEELESVWGQISSLEEGLNDRVSTTTYESDLERLTEADTAQSERIAALEAKFGDGEGSVEDMIADAKQEAIDAAAGDATTKANTAEGNAKTYADGLNTAMNTRVEALEAIDHEHSNKAELDLIATGDKAKWDTAAGKAHEHSNLTVLEGITSAKVEAWDKAEQNAKTYADGLNTTMTAKVDGIDGRVGTLETTIVDKADSSTVTTLAGRVSANETAIAANTSAINSFTAITADEVNALFA